MDGQERKPPLYHEGDIVGDFTVEEYMGLSRQDRAKTYLCRCKCGRTRIVVERELKAGRIWACQRCMREQWVSPTIKDLTGREVGSFRVIQKDEQRDIARHVMWLCECTVCHRQRLIRSDLLLKNKPPRCKCYWRNYHATKTSN